MRERLGLSSVDDGGAPGELIERLLQLAEFNRLRSLGSGELVEVVSAFAAVEAWAAAAQREAAALLQSRHGRGEADPRCPGRVEITGSAADELAMRLGVSRRRAGRLVGEGRLFDGVLNPVGTALAAGLIDAGKASVFSDLLVEQPAPVCFAVCEQVLPHAPGLTHHALRSRIRAVIIQVDPTTAHERAARAASTRRVEAVHLLPDGMASLRLVAPVFDVVTVHTMAEAAARAARADGDSRTLDQLRADALVAVAAQALTAGAIGPCRSTEEARAASGSTCARARASAGESRRADAAGVDGPGPSVPGIPDRAQAGAFALGFEDLELERRALEDATTPSGQVGRAVRTVQSAGARRGAARLAGAGAPPSVARQILEPRTPLTVDAAARGDFGGGGSGGAEPLSGSEAQGSSAPGAVPDLTRFVPFSGRTSRLTLMLSEAQAEPTPVEVPCAADVYAWEFARPSLTDDDGHPYAGYEAPSTCRPGIDVPEVLGFGPLDPATARNLTRRPPPFLTVVVTGRDERAGGGGSGVRNRTTEGYTPDAELDRLVRQAHPTCVAPSCTVPSSACDLDHVVPWPLGPTSELNLRPLCRHHHRLKTFAGHVLVVAPDGSATWRTPTGHTYHRAVTGESRLVAGPVRRTRVSCPSPSPSPWPSRAPSRASERGT